MHMFLEVIRKDEHPSFGGSYTWISRLKLNATRNNSATYRCAFEESENETIFTEMRLQIFCNRFKINYSIRFKLLFEPEIFFRSNLKAINY